MADAPKDRATRVIAAMSRAPGCAGRGFRRARSALHRASGRHLHASDHGRGPDCLIRRGFGAVESRRGTSEIVDLYAAMINMQPNIFM